MQKLGRVALSWLGSLKHGTTILGLGIIVLVWTAIGFHLRNEELRARSAAVQNAGNLVEAFEEHTIRAVKEIDKTILFLRTAFEQSPETFDLGLYARSNSALSDLTVQIALIGPDGMMMASNVQGSNSRVDLSDREHFRVHVGTSDDVLFISKPVVGRASGKVSIQLTRRMTRNGAFAGVIVGSLDPARLNTFYEAIELGSGSSVMLLGTDGIVRAGTGRLPAIGTELPVGSGLLDRVARSASGWFLGTGPDGGEDLVSYTQVKDLPLIVAISIPTSALYEAIGTKRLAANLGAGVLTLLILLVIGFSARHERKLRLAQAEAARNGERAIEKSEELGTTLEHMSQGLMMIDPEGRVRVLNRQAVALLDLPEHFLHTRPLFRDILAWQWQTGEFGNEGETLDEAVREYVRKGGLTMTVPVYERTRPNGRVLEIRSTALPGGGIVRTYTDVTEKTRSAQALAKARDAAEAATRARSAFLAVMSHEIRTPLNGVIGMADLLLETPLNGEQARYTSTLRTSADHLLQIINDVLDFSKLEADGTTFEKIPLDLEATIDSVVEIIAPRANEKGIFVGATLDPDVPTNTKGDPAALRQILLNLVGNGVKFTSEGSVTIAVSREPSLDGAETAGIRISVKDTGIGIPEDSLPLLFKEFSQVDGTISRRFGGTGLGLAITKQLVERLGGHVGVDSEPDVGSIFWFCVPMALEGEARHGARTGEIVDRRILLLCADPVVRDHYARVLRREGAWVEQADGADSGIGRLRRKGAKAYDAALVDDSASSGAAVAFGEAVRTSVVDAGLPLVLVTVAGHRLDPQSPERMLYDRVLARPVTRRELVSALRDGGPAVAAAPAPAVAPTVENRRRRILLAEDNATNRLVIGTQVEKLGFSCDTVENGLLAVEGLRRERYDLVLMDVMMPEMDGYAATRAIRALPDAVAARTPIVALTANVLTADVTAALNAGMDDFATKPISRDRLDQVIRRVLEKVAAETAPARGTARPEGTGDFDRGALAVLMDEIEPDNVRQIIEVFVEDTKARLAAMPKLIDDPVRISREAHAIKSAAATFGMIGVSARAAALEQDATRLEPRAIEASVDALNEAFDDARRHLMSA